MKLGLVLSKPPNYSETFFNSKIKGLHKKDGATGKVFFQCENTFCEYSKMPLPLQVIDELIYEEPPTLLLGTVDKFAMIPSKLLVYGISIFAG